MRLIEFIIFYSILFLSIVFLSRLDFYIYLCPSRALDFLLFLFDEEKTTVRRGKLMTLKSSAEWTRTRARTITFVDIKKEKKREKEHNFFVVHVGIQEKKQQLIDRYYTLCFLKLSVRMSTVQNKSYVVAVDQQQYDRNRKFLRLVLVCVGIIIFLATIFLTVVVYRTWKAGFYLSSNPSTKDLFRNNFDCYSFLFLRIF